MKNITLVGFMGTGKTSTAKVLARYTDRAYVSTDEMIENREKRAITDIFKESGEPYFRKVEKEVVTELGGKEGLVIDAGGGVVLDGANMASLKANGIVVCLWASPETIHERTKRHNDRPLLNVADPVNKIKELLETRRSYYEKADLHVETDGLEPKEVAERIKKIVNGVI